ncbi:hypothetical protein EV175_003245 [Coemansia sp. RSA 1933]|nr:hypothetical protein EV175_003245 [Coemansia sp. RSA 1933]
MEANNENGVTKDDSGSGESENTGSNDGSDSSNAGESDGDGNSESANAESVQQSAENSNSAASADQTPAETNKSANSIIERLHASESLLDHSLTAHTSAYGRDLNNTDQPLGGQGTAADLAVLDYISDRILDEVSSADLLTKSSSVMSLAGASHLDAGSVDVANTAMQRLDCLAREHVMFRRNHFTCGLFLEDKHRPSDEESLERWYMSLSRINVATFMLFIFRPQIVVVEAVVAQNLPNHERVIASLGLKAATRAFFEHIVPSNKRNIDTLGLLVDMQTQMWLLAASDEASLQEIIASERSTSADSIEELLSIYPHSASSDNDSQSFDAQGVSMYRSEINRRLNKLSGGKLNITRSQYPLNKLWISLSQYCVAKVAEGPSCIIRHALSDKEPEGGDLDLADYDHDDDGLRFDESADDDGLDESQQTSIIGDFEVTILKEPKVKDAAVPIAPSARKAAAPLDPSFSEERRVAVLLRDALSDNYLDDLMSRIEAEPIDVSQTRTRVRMYGRPQPGHSGAGYETNDIDDGFRLQIGEGNEGWDAESNGDRHVKEHEIQSTPRTMRTRSQGKRRRVNSEGEEEDHIESSDEEKGAKIKVLRSGPERASAYRELSDPEDAGSMQQILSSLRETPRSKGMQYSPLNLGSSKDGEFQGRRGIAAEDISDLVRSHSPVRFTQSSDGFSGSDDGDGDESGAEGARRLVPTSSAGEEDAAERLGQYRPVQRAKREPEDDDEYDGEGGGGGHGSGHRRVSRRASSQAKHRIRWTLAEEECFVRAMYEHSNGWTAILKKHGVNGTVDHVLAKRNRENLKDKARNIKLRLMREGKPLGPFSAACGHL